MQSSAWEPRSTEDALIAALFQVGRLMKNAGTESADPHTYWLLHTLRCQGTVRMTDLATSMNLDTSTVSRHLQQLDKAGLVQRSQHPDDGRAQAVAITDAGESLLDEAHHARIRFVQARTLAWAPGELETLTRLLTKFADSTPTGSTNASPDEAMADPGRISELEHA